MNKQLGWMLVMTAIVLMLLGVGVVVAQETPSATTTPIPPTVDAGAVVVRETLPNWVAWVIGLVVVALVGGNLYSTHVVKSGQWHLANSYPRDVLDLLKQAGNTGLNTLERTAAATPTLVDDEIVQQLKPLIINILNDLFSDPAQIRGGAPTSGRESG